MKIFCQLIVVNQSSIIETKQTLINRVVERGVVDCLTKKIDICASLRYKDLEAIQLQVHIGNETIFCKHQHYPKKRYVNIFGLEGSISKDLVFALGVPERIDFFTCFALFCLNRMAIIDNIIQLKYFTNGAHVTMFNNIFNAETNQEFESLDRAGRPILEVLSIDVTFKTSGDPLGTDAEYALRLELQDKIGDFLERKKLGEVSGGSIGSGTMEVFCEVKNFAESKRAILKFLSENNYPTPIAITNIEDD